MITASQLICGAFLIAFFYFSLRALGWKIRKWRTTRYQYWNGSEQEVFHTQTIDPGVCSPVYFFQSAAGKRGTNDGIDTRAETSMTLDGMLGHPLEFDPASIELYFEEFSDPEDVVEFLKHSVVEYIVGCDTRMATISGSMFDPVFTLIDPEKGPGATAVSGLLQAALGRKLLDLTHHFTKKIDVRRLGSTDAFSVRIETGRPLKTHGPIRLKVALKGVMWRPGKSEPGRGPKVRMERVDNSYAYIPRGN